MTYGEGRIVASIVAASLALGVAACARKPAEPFRVQREQTTTVTATVRSVDQKTREVVLQGENGKLFTIHADAAVQNLAQVKVGDVVVARYYEALAAEVRPPTEAEKANPVSYAEVAERAQPGERPAAGSGRITRIVGTITSIDKLTQHVTLTDLQGGVTTVKARDPRTLEKVKVGDPVVLTYREAVAVVVEPAAGR